MAARNSDHESGRVSGNVVVGYGVAVVTQILIFPVFGLHTTLAQNLKMRGALSLVGRQRRRFEYRLACLAVKRVGKTTF